MKKLLLLSVFGGLIFFRGCTGIEDTHSSSSWTGPSTDYSVEIIEFKALPGAITRGEPVTLEWVTVNATTVTIDQDIGVVQAVGSQTVYPPDSLTYTLTASNSRGQRSESRQVTVSSAQTGEAHADRKDVKSDQPRGDST